MATTTTNYNLTKPDGTESADIDVINANMDIIDTTLKAKAESSHTHDDRYYTESEVNSKLNGRLPNFINNIGNTNAGNPRLVKFITVDYNTKATYFKMSATSCHDNGTSYQFLEDIIIGATTSGVVVCNVYKYCQVSCGTASANLVDGLEKYYGDVFYTIDDTNKIVDFYILIGQYASAQFTPPTKIGSTSIQYVTPLTGSPVYYSSGTKVWANGNGMTYVINVDSGLSSTSTNPLQNKVVNQAIYNLGVSIRAEIPKITASTTDIGEGSELATGTLYLVYE